MFSEARFPDDIAYGSAGGPVYSTDIVTSAAGYEKRNSNWSQARAVYNVAHGVKSKEQLDALIAFFRARKGRAEGFRFKDWSDYAGINQPLLEIEGEPNRYQLAKYYESGEVVITRVIHKPVSGSVVVYADGSPVSAEIDEITGIVTTSASGALTADYEFDVPVRFETDQLIAQLDDVGIYSWGDIALVEVRL